VILIPQQHKVTLRRGAGGRSLTGLPQMMGTRSPEYGR
jgi:hypothetical protein